MSEKDKRNSRLFLKNIFRPNCSCKHVESIFGSPFAFFSSKGRIFFSQCPKSKKKLVSSFWQPCWKIFERLPKSICSVCENYKIYLIFSQKNSVWSRGHVESSFHNPAENFSPEGRKSLAHLWKRLEHLKFFRKKVIFFQGFRWICGILFWQSCWISFNEKLRKFAKKTKILNKYTVFPQKTP